MKLSIATINTWKCDGAYNERLQLLSKGLGNYSLDIICCQEVFSSNDLRISTEKHLQRQLSMTSFYFPSRKKERIVNGIKTQSFSGLCSLTNLPVLEEKRIYLPSHIDDDERTAQLITIIVEGKKIVTVNTHLTHIRDASGLRVHQINEILKHIDFDESDMVFVCGDLNDTPDSITIRRLTEKHLFNSVLKDYPPTRGDKCIDYIFYRSKEPIEVTKAKRILNKPSEHGVFPSDHLGILATFKL